MPLIDLEGLLGQQVHRDGVAAEGVQHQQVEVLRRLPLQRQPRVPEHDLHLALALAR